MSRLWLLPILLAAACALSTNTSRVLAFRTGEFVDVVIRDDDGFPRCSLPASEKLWCEFHLDSMPTWRNVGQREEARDLCRQAMFWLPARAVGQWHVEECADHLLSLRMRELRPREPGERE